MIDGIDTVAQLMAIAARTAPKTKGEDFVQTKMESKWLNLVREVCNVNWRTNMNDYPVGEICI